MMRRTPLWDAPAGLCCWVSVANVSQPSIRTLADLRASGHVQKTLREEIRDNLLAALADGRDPWPGIHGFERTVIPQLERALIAGHDVVLLGERGQGKTRILRTLPGLLDEWTPVIEGSELGEHPYEPITAESKRRAAELGDALPVAWRHRSERYSEKLATPDTSVADLIGDVDPMRVAEGRRLGDPETIHFGLIPRSHRGIVAINELPDLAERIQVSMLNVMEERDIQIRGYVLRLPLDVLVVASANPEDYTNRGRIITPLKDRFGAEIRTHYPLALDDEIAVIRQEAHLVADLPVPPPGDPGEVHARRCASRRPSTSGRVSRRGSRSPAPRRSRPPRATGQHSEASPRPSPAWSTSRAPSTCWAARSSSSRARRGASATSSTTCCGWRPPRPYGACTAASTSGPLVAALDGSITVTTGEQITARELLEGLPSLSGVYDEVAERFGATTEGEQASAIELALEGLYLARRISKDSGDGETLYG